jgi:hypothetical protein
MLDHINKITIKEARVRFRVQVWVLVRYSGTRILRKVEYRYGGDICFIKFLYILLCIYFLYIDSICEFKSNYG